VVLGHMGIYQSLVSGLGLPAGRQAELFDAVQSKAESDIRRLVGERAEADALMRLPGLMGERPILKEARELLGGKPAAVRSALDQLEALADLVIGQAPEVRLRFDLSELVGYGYHNGPVFSAYHGDLGQALARGGRYDGVGAAFGRGRSATGFDVILNALLGAVASEPAIWVPWPASESTRGDCHAAVRVLRADGSVVVEALSQDDRPPSRCDRVLVHEDGEWGVVSIDAWRG
jgi:ATP phosphoribosyltransferase regulatory subunit